MRILLLTSHLNFGGISSYTVSLAQGLIAADHAVYCASSGGDMQGVLEKSAVTCIKIPINTKCEISPKVLLSLIILINLVKAEKIEIIHAQTRVTQVLAEYLNKISKVPYVTTCHGFFRKNLGRQIFPCWGGKTIAISDAVKKHLMIDFYLSDKNIEMIHNGIDVAAFRVSSKRLDVNHLDRTVGIIARLSDVKGHIYLIEAMAQVIQEFPEARLFIFGQGKIKYELIRRVQELKINGQVFFLPAVSNPAEILQEIDIFVMPSLQEGLGLSILEAQASGLAVIGSNVGGIPALIKHDVNGLLVPAKDSSALAASILKIMENKELAIRLGRQARKMVEEEFNLQTMVKKIERIYTEVISK